MEERFFADRHGVTIGYRRWPHDRPDGVVVIAHGASEHSGRYDRFAGALSEAGLAVYAIDHRGHGLTRRATGTGRMGPPGGIALLDDVSELVGIARESTGGAPLVLFGHSMGAAIALAYATSHSGDIDALILSGFPIPPDGIDAVREGFQAAVDSGMGDEHVDVLSGWNGDFEPARTPFDWLSRDPEEVDAYLRDVFCGDGNRLTYGYFAALFDVVDKAIDPNALREVAGPVLMLTGGDDPAAGRGANAVAVAAALEAARVECSSVVYPGARHELLNETNRDEVTATTIEWIQKQLLRRAAS